MIHTISDVDAASPSLTATSGPATARGGATRRRERWISGHIPMAVRILALLILGTGRPVGAQSVPRPAPALDTFALRGVTVIDVERGRRLDDQTVVVAGSRIQAVGPTRRVRVPAGARVVDARGQYLIPGLWDMHVHVWHYPHIFFPLLIANGVTGIRVPGTPVPLDTVQLWRREVMAGRRVGPRQIVTGAFLETQSGSCPICGGDLVSLGGPPAQIQRIVDSLKAAGADFIKTHTDDIATYYAIVAAAHHAGIPFEGHLPRLGQRTMPASVASDSGQRIIDHVELGGFGACWNGFPGEQASTAGRDTATLASCQELAAHLRRNGTWLVPTLGEAVNHFDREHWNRLQYWPDSLFDADEHASAPGVLPPLPAVPYLALLAQAGLPLLAGTDGSPYAFLKIQVPGFALQDELISYVRGGLTPLQALQTATLNPAQYLGGTDSLGTVAAGKLADLVLLATDPLADIHNIQNIRAVVANGRYYDRAALDELLHEVAQHGARRFAP